jgi:proteasome lid subunit RPN8/RPN11
MARRGLDLSRARNIEVEVDVAANLNVTISQRLLRQFYRRARAAYPLETYCVCLGRLVGKNAISIEELVFPDAEDVIQHEDFVIPAPAWLYAVREATKQLDIDVVGDLHSHCYEVKPNETFDMAMSEADFGWAQHCQKIYWPTYSCTGIAVIHKKGEKLHSRTKFWPLTPEMHTKIVKNA